MSQNQRQKPPTPIPKPPEPSTDQLEVNKQVIPPPIEETIQHVKQALKARTQRRHECRVCHERSCSHYERVDLDTGEEFDQYGPPYTDEDED
jgi:hypothetical protein